jgi:hypothetical protein
MDVDAQKRTKKVQFFDNPDFFGPAAIAQGFRDMYPNTGTASSQLSRFKKHLRLSGKVDEDFLKMLRLEKSEYGSLIENYKKARDSKSRDVVVIHNADLIVMEAINSMGSDDYRVLWPACILLSGLRPADMLTVEIRPPTHEHQHPLFWVSLGGVAKKKKNTANLFDHPLLCPAAIFVRALGIIRLYFNEEQLTKQQLSQRYSKYWDSLLLKSFQRHIPGVTHVLLRRFYAKYAYLYFKSDFAPAVITEHGFIAFALMHESNDPALSYANLALSPPVGNNEIFEIRSVKYQRGGGKKRKRTNSSLIFRAF